MLRPRQLSVPCAGSGTGMDAGDREKSECSVGGKHSDITRESALKGGRTSSSKTLYALYPGRQGLMEPHHTDAAGATPALLFGCNFHSFNKIHPKLGNKDSGKGSSWPRATSGLLQHPAAGWDPEELLRRNARRGPSEGNAFHIIFSQLPAICCFGTSRARGLSPDLAV